MTYEDAINMLDKINVAAKNVSDAGGFERRPITMALDLAIESLKKQIRLKADEYMPLEWCRKLDGSDRIIYSCPNCGKKLVKKEHHCRCGQSIDWSDEDEDSRNM